MCDDIDTSNYDSSDIDTSDVDTSDASYDDSDYDEVPEDLDDSGYEDDSTDEIEEIPEDTEDVDYEGDEYLDDAEEIPEDIDDSDFQEDDAVDDIEDFPEDVEDTKYDDESISETEEIAENIEDDNFEESNETNDLEDIPEDIDDSSEEGIEDTTDEAVDDSTEEGVEDTADEVVDNSAEEGLEDTADETNDDSVEEGVNDTADEAVDDSTGEDVEDTADETVDDSAEEGVEDTADESIDDSVEEKSRDIPNEELSSSEKNDEGISQEIQEKTPQQKLSEYMNSHNYGMEDYDTYSQDPEWQELHSAAFPSKETEVLDEVIDHQSNDWKLSEGNTFNNDSSDVSTDIEESGKFGDFDTDKHINGSEFFIKGDNYEQYKNDYYSPEESTYTKYDEPKEIEISPNDIEGIHISQNDMDNPSLFWSQHETDGSCESFTEIANKIPEVKKQLENDKTIEELIENPELSKCANIYFKNKPKVVQRDGYYEFDSNGRHRILAAREAGQDIPVEVIGKRESVSQLNNDGTDWSRTSNTPEQETILKEMEENGEIEIPEVNDDLSDPQQGTLHLPTVNSGDIVGERASGNFEFIPKSPDVVDHMNSYGRNSVEYKDGYPDFSPFTKHETPWGKVNCNVEIPHMTDQRNNLSLEYGSKRTKGTSHQPSNELGNFAQADNEVVKILQKEYPDLTADEFQKYRESNKLTWHECPDGKTMQLVPTDIHNACRHSGGVAEMKYRMSWGDITRPNPGEE